MSIDLKKARELLLSRQAELQELSDISATDRATVELDQTAVGRLSRMDALQRQAMAQSRQRSRANDLARIELALRRIDDGEYGYCDQCGEEIVEKRLAIDPLAVVCVSCAANK